jgi:hypothetical protein
MQVAHAYLVNRAHLLPDHAVRHRAGINKVLDEWSTRSNARKAWGHTQMNGNKSFWLTRPLTNEMQLYAKEDVDPLLVAYRKMTEPGRLTAPEQALIFALSSLAVLSRVSRIAGDTDGESIESDNLAVDNSDEGGDNDSDENDGGDNDGNDYPDGRPEEPPVDLLDELSSFLPVEVMEHLYALDVATVEALVDIIMDVGRPLAYKILRPTQHSNKPTRLGGRRFHTVALSEADATVDMDMVAETFSRLPPLDRRMRSIPPKSLHRVSALLNRDGDIAVGLTCRVGRTRASYVRVLMDDILRRF